MNQRWIGSYLPSKNFMKESRTLLEQSEYFGGFQEAFKRFRAV
jgi:hypothetical protein